MKRILIVMISLLFIVGCGCSISRSAVDVAKNYLNKYQIHDKEIMDELDKFIDKEDLTKDQKEKYKNILKKQYKDIKYEITNEEYNGNKATITAKIEVYDLYKVQKDADEYLLNNKGEFDTESGEFDKSKFVDYKLDKMEKQSKTASYSILIELEKKGNDWFVLQLSDDDLNKIHGIFNYE